MVLKCFFDRIIALFALLFLWPVLLVAAIMVKGKMPGGPAFFVQKRVGKNGKLFNCHKFRTMTVKHNGSTVSVAGDSRITPFGATLRHYKLDELPGLWDVLISKMSFVGPRPDVPGYADKQTGEDRDVLKLRPGITGPATLKYRLEDEMISEYVAKRQAEKAILDRKEKTGYPKAIITVALYGMPYDCERIRMITDKYGIPVIEDAAEGMGSRFNGQVLGTFGRFGVLSFNGNKMITTSGGGALICRNEEDANNIMWHATQARDAYPYYQHTKISYNYRMSNVCAGIGRGQMTVLDEHIAHHKHVQALYKELLKEVKGSETLV